MNKIVVSIIVLISGFSITNSVNASGYIDNLLEIPTGPEAFDITLESLDYYSFNSPQISKVYNDFREVNEVLRDEIVRKYNAGDFDYYQMQGIIKNYKMFVYHTNKLFEYLSLKDNGIWGKSIDTAILRTYQNTRIYYNRMKYIISQSY